MAKKLHPTLAKRAKLHAKIHHQIKHDAGYQALTPQERFAAVAGAVSKAMKAKP